MFVNVISVVYITPYVLFFENALFIRKKTYLCQWSYFNFIYFLFNVNSVDILQVFEIRFSLFNFVINLNSVNHNWLLTISHYPQ